MTTMAQSKPETRLAPPSETMGDLGERVAQAKTDLDLAEGAVKYYQRVGIAAEVRRDEKRHIFLAALADLKAKGGT